MELNDINKLLDEVNSDRTVPRNIRILTEQAKKDLNNAANEMSVRINSAVSILDEVSNDPNIPTYTRTQIWNAVSMLEAMNEKHKDK
ncbi:MAG: UPF0147 family protein [Candidatus Aenigmarchaeota archaeon]|nr:UPF0147 family protein [Candidatus Aenigmarchaeota archaeon]MDI6722985.1 UPF0147 family protein [Candidatus Aenigmarchaeota archaeon]